MSDVLEGEVVNTLATVDQEQALAVQSNLFGVRGPLAVLQAAKEVAAVLADVIEQQKLFTLISNRKHVRVEGWTFLGSMLGVTGTIVGTEEILDGQGRNFGFKARAEARRLSDGVLVGSAESRCLRSESTWNRRDDYALESMAQTRALSKALRGPLGFVVVLAGYEECPAEEIPRDDARTPQPNPGHEVHQQLIAAAKQVEEWTPNTPPGKPGNLWDAILGRLMGWGLLEDGQAPARMTDIPAEVAAEALRRYREVGA